MMNGGHRIIGSCGLLQIGGGRVMDEVEVDAELQARRHAQPGYIEPSFPTIAGYHSRPPPPPPPPPPAFLAILNLAT